MTASEPTVSIVVLTKDESANIEDCLAAVHAQLALRDEVIVIDSASRDDTVARAKRHAAADPGRVRVHASSHDLSFGAARNLGVTMARADVIVFLSADAVPSRGWLDGLRRAIRNADIVYGRQTHAPPGQNLATVSRGLRYHHFEDPGSRLPETYASNVNAAYRRFAFRDLKFDEKAPGAEDVAFARLARLAGLRIAYAHDAVVRHKDVATFRGEWRKHAREGAAYAQLRALLGAPRLHVAWALLVGASATLAALTREPWAFAILLAAFFAPTFRRLASPAARRYKVAPLVAAAAASPLFDLVFLSSYLRGRVLP